MSPWMGDETITVPLVSFWFCGISLVLQLVSSSHLKIDPVFHVLKLALYLVSQAMRIVSVRLSYCVSDIWCVLRNSTGIESV
jgi:hypothetical protein